MNTILHHLNPYVYSFYEESSQEHDQTNQDYKHIFRNFLRDGVPIWTSIPASMGNGGVETEKCTKNCIINGLQWAHDLGESAQNGFNVLFKRIHKSTILNPSLDYYITILYKKLLGEKVFDTNLVFGSQKAQQSYFAHCTRDMSGSFTVMGVNFAKTKSKVLSKLQNRYTGAEILEYIVTVDEGQIMLNGYPITVDSVIQPSRRIKRSNRPFSFTLPPTSVGFWTFPLASLKECMQYTDFEDLLTSGSTIVERRPLTTSDVLLQQLIRESVTSLAPEHGGQHRQRRHLVVKKDSNHMHRNKRDLTNAIYNNELHSNRIEIDSGEELKRDYRKVPNNEIHQRQKRTLLITRSRSKNGLDSGAAPRKGFHVPNAAETRLTKRGLFGKKNRPKRQVNNALTKLFEKFEFKKPLGLSSVAPRLFNLGPAAIPPVSTVHDVFKVTSNENLFQSSENIDLPHGDVYFEVEQGDDEFVAYDEHGNPLVKPGDFALDIPDDVRLQKAPQFVEYYTDMNGRQLTNVGIPVNGELWEADVYQKPPPPESADKMALRNDKQMANGQDPKVTQKNIEFVIKELEPTWKKNQENLVKARENMQNFYIRDNDRSDPRNAKYYATKKGAVVDSDDDHYYVRRQRRSVSSSTNYGDSGITDNVGAEVFDQNRHMNRSQTNRLSLIGRITSILKSIEKIDETNDYESVAKFSDDVRDLEDFLAKRMPGLRLFRQQHPDLQQMADTNEIKRKCKIISLNLEQQCLREDETFGRTFGKREAKYFDEAKSKKAMGQKKFVSPKDAKLPVNRSKRSVNFWEIDAHPNAIPKEFYSDTELGSTIYQPTIVYSDTYKTDKADQNVKTTTEISHNQPLKKPGGEHVYNVIPLASEHENGNKKDAEVNPIEGKIFIDEDDTFDYDSPRFMKTFTRQVHGLMDFVNRHVADWWHWMS